MKTIAPPEWFYSLAPLDDGAEDLDIDCLIAKLDARIAAHLRGEEIDIARALHVCHVLKAEQGEDGRWAAVVNARTGEAIGSARTLSPVPLFKILNKLLDSSEFELAVMYAERGGSESNRES